MVTNLKTYKLNNDLAYQFFSDNLKETDELSSEVMRSIDFKTGNLFTILNDDIDPKSLYEFTYGGVSTGVVPTQDLKLLENPPPSDHYHLSSPDYQQEITLCICEPENINDFNPRIQKLIRDDE